MPARGHIYLCGFSGSGKSTVGALLAEKLSFKFVDLDTVIARNAGCSIEQIFADHGEKKFRLLELKALKSIASQSKKKAVVALGGGALHNQQVIGSLKESGVLVYLSCAVTEIYNRLKKHSDRPMLNASKYQTRAEILARMNRLMHKRTKMYCQADLRISTTNRTPRQVANRLKSQLVQKYDIF